MSEYESLKKRLFNHKKCGWETIGEEEKQKIDKFGDERYYAFTPEIGL